MALRRIAGVVAVVSWSAFGLALTAQPAAAASYGFSACQQFGTGTPPAGLDQLTLAVTGTAPPTAPQGAIVDVSGVSVSLTNPHPYPIATTVVGLTANIPPGSTAFTAGFPSPFPFTIPASGTALFTGSLQYVATGGPGTALEFRPSVVTFNFGPSLAVSCTVASGAPAFASTVILDAPGYQYSCEVPSLGVTVQQTVDVVGTAPATAARGSSFSLTGVTSTSTPPITTTVLSSAFSIASPTNATPLTPLVISTPGPYTLPAGESFTSPPASFDFRASGPVGSLIEFRPGPITTDTQQFGAVNCTLISGQPPLATTTITAPAPALDEIAIAVLRPNGERLYVQHAPLESGDFVLTRDAHGRLTAVNGEGTFAGSAGGDASLRIQYSRPMTGLRLRDPASGLDLRAFSFLPAASPPGSDLVVGVAFGRLGGKPVVVVWVIRDTA